MPPEMIGETCKTTPPLSTASLKTVIAYTQSKNDLTAVNDIPPMDLGGSVRQSKSIDPFRHEDEHNNRKYYTCAI